MKAFCVTPVTDDRKHLLEKTGVEITFNRVGGTK